MAFIFKARKNIWANTVCYCALIIEAIKWTCYIRKLGAGNMFETDPKMSMHKQETVIRTVKQRDSRKKT